MELTKEAISSADDLTIREVKVPEWGGSVYVRMMSGDERDAYELSAQGGQQKHVRARLVAMTLCDSSGKLLFGLDELEKIGAKQARPSTESSRRRPGTTASPPPTLKN